MNNYDYIQVRVKLIRVIGMLYTYIYIYIYIYIYAYCALPYYAREVTYTFLKSSELRGGLNRQCSEFGGLRWQSMHQESLNLGRSELGGSQLGGSEFGSYEFGGVLFT